MATVNITGQFLNKEKRSHDTIVVTVPSVLVPTSGRTNAAPQYIQANDVMSAAVVEAGSVLTKAYLIIDEAFPTGTTITVTGYGQTLFTAVVATATGLTVSSVVDKYLAAGGSLTVAVLNASAGNIVTGKVRLVVDTISPLIKTGSYAVIPV